VGFTASGFPVGLLPMGLHGAHSGGMTDLRTRLAMATVTRAGMRSWAATSGLAGLAGNIFLILFYLTARPWQESAGSMGWFGRADDSLVAIQYLALLPVVRGLGQRLRADTAAGVWTRIGLAAAAAVVGLQVLLIARIFPFAVQVAPVTVCAVASVCWAGAISSAGERLGALPAPVSRLGRVLGVGLPIGLAVFLLGFLLALLTGPSWLWVVGAMPGFAVWFLFPVWTLLLAAPVRS
jgi:hypothetical protein